MANTVLKVLWGFNFNDKFSAFVNEWNWMVHGKLILYEAESEKINMNNCIQTFFSQFRDL